MRTSRLCEAIAFWLLKGLIRRACSQPWPQVQPKAPPPARLLDAGRFQHNTPADLASAQALQPLVRSRARALGSVPRSLTDTSLPRPRAVCLRFNSLPLRPRGLRGILRAWPMPLVPAAPAFGHVLAGGRPFQRLWRLLSACDRAALARTTWWHCSDCLWFADGLQLPFDSSDAEASDSQASTAQPWQPPTWWFS